MNLSVVVLAAGKSTRFKSSTSKVLHPLGGKPMLHHVLDAVAPLNSHRPVVVVGPETRDPIAEAMGEDARLVVQERRLGTAHAVEQARFILGGDPSEGNSRVLILYADMPLLRTETLRALVEAHAGSDAAISLLTVERENPRGFGRVVRAADGDVRAVVEEAEATPEIAAIRELNSGIYVFDAAFLWDYLPRVERSPEKGEYYLTDLVGLAVEAGLRVQAVQASDPGESMGINTRVDLAAAAAILRRRVNERWMLEGVTIVDPATTYIDMGVTLGQDTVIHPGTHLQGHTTVGEGSVIGPHAIVRDCTIGDRCRVVASVLEEAVMEDESDIGPFGHLRKGARLCQGAHMGNFGEMKNSTLGPGAKMGHFSYLGDAEVGAEVNIGAGTITCNYDGVRKHRTTIEEGAFIGSDTMLVAPLRIGAGAKTGAGSVVTRDLPAGALAYGVPARVQPSPAAEEDEDRER